MTHLDRIPNNEKEIWTRLENAGFPTFLVGGAVRDSLLNKVPSDFDFSTKATPDEIIALFSDKKVNLVGKSFGVVLVDGIEIATFRGDKNFGVGDKNVEITFVDTIEEDLSRRDFTVNAMAVSFEGKVIDPHDGILDITNKILRFVGDAKIRIFEDPNRIIRLARFAAKLEGFAIEANAVHEILAFKNPLVFIAPERIRLEILKAMDTIKPSRFFFWLKEFGILGAIFPELAASWKHTGGNHHPETVWEHFTLAGDSISPRFPIIRLAGFLHDIGKPTAFKKNGNGKFSGHDKIGEEIARQRLSALRFTNEEIDTIANLIGTHMTLLLDLSDKAKRKLFKKFADRNVQWREFLRVRIADQKANLGVHKKPFGIGYIRDAIRVFTEDFNTDLPLNIHGLAVSGGEIIKEFGIKPGPIVGKIQKSLLAFVIDKGEEFNTSDVLFGEAWTILHNEKALNG